MGNLTTSSHFVNIYSSAFSQKVYQSFLNGFFLDLKMRANHTIYCVFLRAITPDMPFRLFDIFLIFAPYFMSGKSQGIDKKTKTLFFLRKSSADPLLALRACPKFIVRAT
jgi:hypothetical protein